MVLQCKNSVNKGFKTVAGFSYNGKLKIRSVGKNNINLMCYQEEVLHPIFAEEISFIPNNFHGVTLTK